MVLCIFEKTKKMYYKSKHLVYYFMNQVQSVRIFLSLKFVA